MKRITSIILIFTLVCILIPAFADNLYEYTDTFETIDNWNLGSGWALDNDSKSLAINSGNVLSTFKDNDGTLNNISDYVVSADFATKDIGSLHAIVFRHTSNSAFYMFRIKGQYAEFYKSTVAKLTSKADSRISISNNVPYNLKVVVKGNTFTGYFNDIEVLSVTDTSYPSGGVGVRSNDAVSVDNFYVANLDRTPRLASIKLDDVLLNGFSSQKTSYEVTDVIEYPTVSATALNPDITEGYGIVITQASDENNGTATIEVTTAENDTLTYTIAFVLAEDTPTPPDDNDDPPVVPPVEPPIDNDIVIVDNSYLEAANNPAGFVRTSSTGINNSFSRAATLGGSMAVFTESGGSISFYPKVSKSGKYKIYASWAGNEWNRTDGFNYAIEFSINTKSNKTLYSITQNTSNSNTWATNPETGENTNVLGTTVWNEIGTVNLYEQSTDAYVTATGKDKNSRIDCIKFEYVGEPDLEATDMAIKLDESIITSANVNDTIKASYTLNKPELDNDVTFSWEFCDTEDGIFLPIRNANTDTFTIDEKYAGKYLRFVISVSADKEYTFSSAPIKVTDIVSNIISEIKISGAKTQGNAITVTPVITENVSKETEMTYSILVSVGIDGTYTQLGEAVTLESIDSFTYTLPEQAEKAVIIRIKIADVYMDSNPFVIRNSNYVSSVTDVNISYSGTLNTRSVLTGNYQFINNYGDIDNSTYRWLKGSTATTLSSIAGETSNVLTLNSEYEGCYVAFEVTPKGDGDLTAGQAVVSSVVYIPKKSGNTPSYGGSGGGGGGGVSSSNSFFGTSAVTAPVQVENTTPSKLDFKDVKNHWAEESINKMVELGLLKGVSDTQFEPERNITRAEFITVVVRALKLDNAQYQSIFSDVTDADWFAKEISAAYAAKLVSGNDGLFNPNNSITREEAAKILVNAYKLKNNNITSKTITFKDENKISDWAQEYVQDAYSLGFIKGDTNGMFLPKDNATRAQAATMIERLFNIIN